MMSLKKFPAVQSFNDKRIQAYAKWKKVWPEVPVKDITNPGPKMQALLSHINEYAMGVIFKQYQIGPAEWPNPGKFAVDEFHLYLHCYDLFNRSEIDADFRPDHVNDKNPQFIDPWDAAKSLEMQSLNGYAFIAELADFFNAGFAYGGKYAIGEQALVVATACYKEWTKDDQFATLNNNTDFYSLGHGWSSWFIGEWIDYAWASYERNTGIVTVLLVTDTD